MAAGTRIPGTPAEGKVKTVIIPAMAGTAPTLAEANAATGADLSCYLTAGGWNGTHDQAPIVDERECSTTTANEPGRKSHSLAITAIDNTNTDLEEDYNLAVETLVEDEQKIALRRRGKPHTLPFATGDKVTVWLFKPGQRGEVPAEANSMIRSTWPTFVQDVYDAVIGAA